MNQESSLVEELAQNLLGDDIVTPFEVEALGVRGRVVRLGDAVTALIERHNYPAIVSAVLAEAVGLAALLGTTLKFDGKFILQTRTDGPIDMIVVDFVTPGSVRGYAHFDAEKVAEMEAAGNTGSQHLLGVGHLAMTIDQGPDMERYQGIVALEGVSLAQAAHDYFQQSEQIPTEVRLAAGPVIAIGSEGRETWRMGGILIQHLPREGEASPMELSSGDAPEGTGTEGLDELEEWVRAKVLMETVEDHELLDPTLTTDRLLFRLYHEDGVRAYNPQPVVHSCHCSRTRIQTVIEGFTAEEIAETAVDGKIVATCEFCAETYEFDAGNIGG
ncbi:MAG: Hsp33 family molecular chaperone [Hyphomicrobiales bacterium]